MPAPSCPNIEGNKPSGSAPDRVNSSVWQIPVALISTSTSPALGPAKSTVMISSGFPAAVATAALVFIWQYPPRYGHRIQSERSAHHRLPDREGDHHSRSISPFAECVDQCLQSKDQPRTGAQLERGRSAAIGRYTDEKVHDQRQI